ncbi:unnamed protein product [Cochlearia groenlandica]
MGKGFRLVATLLLFLFFLFSGTKASEPIKDITTPLATNPTSPTIINAPNSDSAVATTPLTIPSPPHSDRSWCVARENAAKIALQAALDYACGMIGGVDCLEIQQGGKCYNPNSLRQHSSFAFNSYYQKNPIPTSCNFGGTAVTVNVDPSVGTCHFPSTSTSESILNITSEDGLGFFGRVPSHPSHKPEASSPSSTTYSHFSASILVFFPLVLHILLICHE